tara:strand:+ start:102 stop:809 length:708 start_codon:yes stop_codon:yes gene_type:complete
MKKELNKLINYGFIIVKPNSKKKFLKLQNEILKAFNFLLLKNKRNKIKNINELLKKKNLFNHEFVNELRKIYVKNLNKHIVNTYSNFFKRYFSKEFFVQKYCTIRVLHPTISSSALNPHIEAHAGHSPFTFNFWTPYHKVHDNSGIWLLPLKDSLQILKKEKSVLHRKKLIQNSKNLFFPQFEEGESILFNSFIYHGSNMSNKNPLRISSDIRVQKKNSLFLYKFNEFFEPINLD